VAQQRFHTSGRCLHHIKLKWAKVTQEKMACPLDHDPSNAAFWSCSPRDKVFGAHYDAFATQFTGYSVCHPIYADAVMHRATQHAIHSAITSTIATATFMILPTYRGTNAYNKLIWANSS